MYKNFFRAVCLFQQIEKELLTLKSNFVPEFCSVLLHTLYIHSVYFSVYCLFWIGLLFSEVVSGKKMIHDNLFLLFQSRLNQ